MDSKKPKSNLEQQIDENLKKVYRKTVEEDVPDRFMDLLAQLKQQETQDGK
ncbi:NepR family anti-sigma factor [Marivivens niveibacter]|uniref:NepR family anti-sigma factor n=1 Tax=Marivivens niveibacter TaxID=1930667 RepID=UPI000BA9EEA1|nr:NepR family anti-sigma factor [Marivivens niveibacter]